MASRMRDETRIEQTRCLGGELAKVLDCMPRLRPDRFVRAGGQPVSLPAELKLLTNTASMDKGRFWRWGMLAAIVLSGLLLRAHHLSRIFLWLDETDMFNEYVYSDHHKSLVDFALSTRDATTVTWGWPGVIWIVSRFFGPTIQTARIPTVLVSAAGILVLFFLVYRLLPRNFRGDPFWPAIFAALFACVSIIQLEYAQRTYPYGATPCLAAAILLAHFQVLRAASGGWKYSPKLFRAVALYTVVASIALCIHASLALLPAISVAFLCVNAVGDLFRQPWPERWKVLRLALGAGAILGCAALLNAKNPKYGFRVYLANYYAAPSLRSIPKLLLHAYDLAVYHLNLFYNPALYWPERLNVVLLPLVLLCILGWSFAVLGKFGPHVRHFAFLGLAAVIAPAFLSVVKMFPFGGVRQSLFLSPFLLAFTALGFYALRARLITRILAMGIASGYLVLWAVNLPAFYQQRQARYTPDELVSAWKQNGSLPVYARECERELRYELRQHPEIQIATLPLESKPPYLLIGTHNWIGDGRWYGGFPEYLQRSGYRADLVKEAPAWHPEIRWHSQSLYFPPNGLWIYKVTGQ